MWREMNVIVGVEGIRIRVCFIDLNFSLIAGLMCGMNRGLEHGLNHLSFSRETLIN